MANGPWEVIVPVGDSFNEVTNPSLEESTTGWAAASSATIARTTAFQRWGHFSLEVNPTSASSDGCLWGTASLAAGDWNLSAYVLGASGVDYQLQFYDSENSSIIASTNFTGLDGWQRVSASAAPGASAEYQAFIIKNNDSSGSPFYVDGLQITSSSFLQAYFDGDQEGSLWLATDHASRSKREGQFGGGGRVKNLEGDLGLTVTNQPGTGVPPVKNVSTPYGFLDGVLYQGSVAQERNLTLTGFIKGSPSALAKGDVRAAIHSKRKAIIDAFKRDRVVPDQPVRLRYTGAGSVLEIDAVYDAGLEFGVPEGTIEQLGVRLTAYDPYWRTEGNVGASLAVSTSLSPIHFIAERSACGEWGNMGGGLDWDVLRRLKYGPDNLLYAGGASAEFGGILGSGMARWDGSSWETIGGSVVANNEIRDFAFGPDGTLYVGGLFTMFGSSTIRYFAQWSGSVWGATGGACPNGEVLQVIGAGDGSIYIAGLFGQIGGSTMNGIAQWNGADWINVGSPNLSGPIVEGLDGNIYAASGNNVAYWDRNSWTVLSAGSAFDKTFGVLQTGPDGTLYAGGRFSEAGGVAACRIAQWNGNQWLPLDRGLGSASTENVTDIVFDPDGILYAVGSFDKAGDLDLPDGAARWNGYAWFPLDISFDSASISTVATNMEGKVVVGLEGALGASGTASAAAVTQLTNNGQANAYPALKVRAASSASSQLIQFVNRTSQDAVYFNLTINPGETVTLDLSPGKKSFVSSYRGNIINRILPGSNVASWRLLPGENTVSLFVTGGDASAWISWQERHWSVDAGT